MIHTVDSIPYVTLNDLCKTLQLRMKWQQETATVSLGDYAPEYVLQVGSTDATKAGKAMKLPQSPILSNSEVLLPVCSIGSLFQDELQFTVMEKSIQFSPVKQASIKASFHIGEATEKPSGEVGSHKIRAKGARTQGSADDLVQRARRYVGVGYEFAAAPFPESGTFDASSYLQYIFQHEGIPLARSLSEQAEQGTRVQPDKLQKGDVLFFQEAYRYRTSHAAHAGLYIGDYQMIHAAPEPKKGVQISRIDTVYWNDRFVKAQRMVAPGSK
ncbi:C40 family peptidase [Paenibacillus rigui]|nr:C40 family peptidase [Paenibacillus rigui]